MELRDSSPHRNTNRTNEKAKVLKIRGGQTNKMVIDSPSQNVIRTGFRDLKIEEQKIVLVSLPGNGFLETLLLVCIDIWLEEIYKSWLPGREYNSRKLVSQSDLF